MVEDEALPARRLLQTPRRKTGGLFAGSLGFVAVAVVLLIAGETLMWLPLVFFGACAAVFALQLRTPSTLELTSQGLTYRVLGREHAFDWRECGEFQARKSGRGRRIVAFNCERSRAESPGAVNRLGRRWVGADEALPDTFGMKPERLASLLNRYRSAAK